MKKLLVFAMCMMAMGMASCGGNKSAEKAENDSIATVADTIAQVDTVEAAADSVEAAE